MKLYLPEAGSREVVRVIEGRADVIVSDLALTELASALGRRVRQGDLTRDDALRAQRAITTSIEAAQYQRAELTREVHRRAEHLLLTMTPTPLRAADALHLALAMSARAASMAVFDARLAGAARAVGFDVYPA